MAGVVLYNRYVIVSQYNTGPRLIVIISQAIGEDFEIF